MLYITGKSRHVSISNIIRNIHLRNIWKIKKIALGKVRTYENNVSHMILQNIFSEPVVEMLCVIFTYI